MHNTEKKSTKSENKETFDPAKHLGGLNVFTASIRIGGKGAEWKLIEVIFHENELFKKRVRVPRPKFEPLQPISFKGSN